MEKLVCMCNQVSEKEILDILLEFKNADLQMIAEKTKASTSCGRCKRAVDYLISIYQKSTL